MDQEIVTKGEFSKLCNVTPGRVSQWISEGKISGEALVGTGRLAKIKVAVAQAQLKQKLDVSQSLGNGVTTKLDSAAPAMPAGESVEDKIKAQKLEQVRYQNRKLQEEERARTGVYMRSDLAQAEIARAGGLVLKVVEGGLNDMATAVAAQFDIPQRDVLHVLKMEIRNIRSSATDSLRHSAANMPEHVKFLAEAAE